MLALAFGHIKRLIGLLQQRLRAGGMIGINGNTDADIDRYPVSAGNERHQNVIKDSFGQCARFGHTVFAKMRNNDHLVPTGAGNQIPTAHTATQPTGNFTQHLVPCRMPQPVIDRFEIVQIKNKNAKLTALAVGLRQGML